MSRKSYWSAIKNAHENLERKDHVGQKARLAFLEESKLKIFTEKNFEKNGIKKSQVIKAYSKIKKDRNTMLKKAWNRHTKGNMKLRKTTKAFHKFKKANRTTILNEVGTNFEFYFDSPNLVK